MYKHNQSHLNRVCECVCVCDAKDVKKKKNQSAAATVKTSVKRVSSSKMPLSEH